MDDGCRGIILMIHEANESRVEIAVEGWPPRSKAGSDMPLKRFTLLPRFREVQSTSTFPMHP